MKKIILFFLVVMLSACGDQGSSNSENSGNTDKDVLDEKSINNKTELSWVAPLKRVNGMVLDLSEIDRYVVKHRFKEDEIKKYTVQYPEDSYVIENLEKGVHYFSVTVFDNNGLESQPSSEVFKKI